MEIGDLIHIAPATETETAFVAEYHQQVDDTYDAFMNISPTAHAAMMNIF